MAYGYLKKKPNKAIYFSGGFSYSSILHSVCYDFENEIHVSFRKEGRGYRISIWPQYNLKLTFVFGTHKKKKKIKRTKWQGSKKEELKSTIYWQIF